MDDLSGIWKCLFWRRRVSWNTQQKTSQSKGENQQQIPSTYGVEPGTYGPPWLPSGLPLSYKILC